MLVTGPNGFIGKNLLSELKKIKGTEIVQLSRSDNINNMEAELANLSFVFHLAGVNRTNDVIEFERGNSDLTHNLVTFLEKINAEAPIVYTSSIQALKDNEYGISKKKAEDHLFEYANRTNKDVFIYRLPNVFGPLGRPYYNSAIHTFCYNISREIPIEISDPNHKMSVVYVGDVIQEFIDKYINHKNYNSDFYQINNVFQITLGEIVSKIYDFKNNKDRLSEQMQKTRFDKLLYKTYESYLPKNFCLEE